MENGRAEANRLTAEVIEHDGSSLAELTAIQTAAQSACALEGTSVKSINIAVADGKITVTAENNAADQGEIDEAFGDFYDAPDNLVSLLEKHSNYDAVKSDGIGWTEDGWDLLIYEAPANNS